VGISFSLALTHVLTTYESTSPPEVARGKGRTSRFTDRSGLVAVRISRDYRAVGVQRSPDQILWFWVGTHSEYERLLAKR
jgi:hypothetical protein